jgi:hypothetical protein
MIRMAMGIDNVLEGQVFLLDEIDQFLFVPGRIDEKSFFGPRARHEVTENVHEPNLDLFNDHKSHTLHFTFIVFPAQKIPLPSPPSASPSIFLRAVSLSNGSGRAALQRGKSSST